MSKNARPARAITDTVKSFTIKFCMLLFFSSAFLLILLFFISTLFMVPDKPRSEIIAKYANHASIFLPLSNYRMAHVRDQGKQDGPVMVLIHGDNGSLHSWEPWVAELGDRYRMITMDLPGHGITGPVPDENYSRQAMSRFVRELTSQLKIDKFILIGISLGGSVALQYALEHREQVQGLVLIGASGLKRDEADKDKGFLKLANWPGVSRLMRYITPYGIVEESVLAAYGTPVAVNKKLVDRYYDLLLHVGNREAVFKQLKQRTQEDPLDIFIGGIIAPTLLLWGEEDILVPLKYGRRMRAHIPASELISYPGMGHVPVEISPKLTALHADQFIRREILNTDSWTQ